MAANKSLTKTLVVDQTKQSKQSKDALEQMVETTKEQNEGKGQRAISNTFYKAQEDEREGVQHMDNVLVNEKCRQNKTQKARHATKASRC